MSKTRVFLDFVPALRRPQERLDTLHVTGNGYYGVTVNDVKDFLSLKAKILRWESAGGANVFDNGG